jgi:predicted transcriptional regulator
MSRYFALLSIVFMMGFVMVFDKVHLKNCNVRFCKKGVLSRQEVDQLLRIMSACGEC